MCEPVRSEGGGGGDRARGEEERDQLRRCGYFSKIMIANIAS